VGGVVVTPDAGVGIEPYYLAPGPAASFWDPLGA